MWQPDGFLPGSTSTKERRIEAVVDYMLTIKPNLMWKPMQKQAKADVGNKISQNL